MDSKVDDRLKQDKMPLCTFETLLKTKYSIGERNIDVIETSANSVTCVSTGAG